MKTATVTESKNGLSELLRSARAGKSVLMLDRDVPVARLEPVATDTLPDAVRLLGLERQGLIRRPQKAGSVWDDLKATPAPRLKTGAVLVRTANAPRVYDWVLAAHLAGHRQMTQSGSPVTSA